MTDLERYRANPLQNGLGYLVEAGEHAAAGHADAALAALERALAEGCRYKREWLQRDERLAPLRALPRFAQITAQADARYAEAAAAARPNLTFAIPDDLPDAFGYPLLIALHGNNSNARETAPQWVSMADRGWVVAVPQSSEIGMTPNAYTWNDRERAAAEITTHIERVKRATSIDIGRIVLAGFSMGGLQAITLALSKQVKARGFVAVAAWLPHVGGLAEIVEAGASKMLRGYLVVGDQDPSRAGAGELVELLRRHGNRVELDARAHLGHEYPADMAETLARALALVTAP